LSILRGPAETCWVTAVCADSRQVKEGAIFFAVPGSAGNGTDYVLDAVKKGAVAIAVPEQFAQNALKLIPEDTVILASDRPRTALGQTAAAFYGFPSHKLRLIGITGTNGKTTCSYILENILLASGARCGLSGTIVQKTAKGTRTSTLTTPDPVSFQRFLAELVDEGVEFAIAEVSSHGLSQGRTEGCRFHLGLFTNLTHDHLDYHKDMEEYFQAKKLLFSRYQPDYAIINTDDKWGMRLFNETGGQKISYGLSDKCAARAYDYITDSSGIRASIQIKDQDFTINSQLIGQYNLYNILAAAAAAFALGIKPEFIKAGIESLKNVPGRLEKVVTPSGITALVDYAHTPDALKNVLNGLKNLARDGRIITVVGCGGDRDRTKRPEMAKIAAQFSDLCVFTSDNPRKESPKAILRDMVSEFKAGLPENAKVIEDRKEAIFWAAKEAKRGDIVLVAGKGHEPYQIIGTKKYAFNDKSVLEEAFSKTFDFSTRRSGPEKISLHHVVQAAGGRLNCEAGTVLFTGISTDTRTIQKGQLFWALKGETFDGHSFVAKAAEKQASGAVVERFPKGVPSNFPLIMVKDSLQALGDFAQWYKKHLGFKVFGITGSCGKTTTKELLLSILKTSFKAQGTRGNFNNLIGLPLTMLSVTHGTQWVVLEMGTNLPGEIERLCQIAEPAAGLITCVKPVHLEGLGSVENIADEKAMLLKSIPSDGMAVLNMDDPLITRMLPEITCRNIIGFTCHDMKNQHGLTRLVSLKKLVQSRDGLKMEIISSEGSLTIHSKLYGRVNASNILAAVAAGMGLGLDTESIRQGIERVEAPPGRMRVLTLQEGSILVDDSYNANPASMKAAIEAIHEISGDCGIILILGDMLELGADSWQFHEEIGAFAATKLPELLITVGKLGRYIAKGAEERGLPQERLLSFNSTEQLLDWMRGKGSSFFSKPGRAILVKASRGMGLDRVVLLAQKRPGGDE